LCKKDWICEDSAHEETNKCLNAVTSSWSFFLTSKSTSDHRWTSVYPKVETCQQVKDYCNDVFDGDGNDVRRCCCKTCSEYKSNHLCRNDTYKLPNWVQKHEVCDGRVDCNDGSDEENCQSCSESELKNALSTLKLDGGVLVDCTGPIDHGAECAITCNSVTHVIDRQSGEPALECIDGAAKKKK
jgi:hypothetical protein